MMRTVSENLNEEAYPQTAVMTNAISHCKSTFVAEWEESDRDVHMKEVTCQTAAKNYSGN